MTISRETLQQLVDRVVLAARPERIILFGSAARGTMTPQSDIDLLVIKSGVFDRARLTGDIYKSFRGLECDVEVIVATPEELERYGASPALVYGPARREGKVIYDAVPAG